MNKKLLSGTTLLIITAIVFLEFIFVVDINLAGAKVDMTENKLYTMTEGTKSILSQIDEPINIYFYYSQKLTKDIPNIRNYASRVKEVLKEYELNANGKINLQIIDPEPFSEQEEKAKEFGIQPIPLTQETNIYLGIAATNAIDDQEIIGFLQPDNESYLEYELSKIIYSLAHPEKPVVGVISSLPIYGQIDPRTGKTIGSWGVYQLLQQLFDMRIIEPGFTEIDDDIDTLMIVHPKAMPDASQYAIDQFVLKGGRALLFVDAHSDAEVAVAGNRMQDNLSDKSSSLEKLMTAWGIKQEKDSILADMTYAIPVGVSYQNRPKSHITVLGFENKALNDEDVITRELEKINMAHCAVLSPIDGAPTTLTPLISSSEVSGTLPTTQVKFTVDPSQLLDMFKSEDKKHVVAYRISGNTKSAFAAPINNHESTPEHVTESKQPINVIVVGDSDMLKDQMWARMQQMLDESQFIPIAHNASFVINAVEQLAGSTDLITIRSRGTYMRPFERLQEMRFNAEQRYREKEKELIEKRDEMIKNISQIEAQRDQTSSITFTPEQGELINKFVQEKDETDKKLRVLRHQLDKDIENLGTLLKWINILAVPFLVAVFGIIVALIRSNKRYKKYRG